MKKFIEIDGYIIAVDAIVMIHPPGKDNKKTFIQLVGDRGYMFPEEPVSKLRAML